VSFSAPLPGEGGPEARLPEGLAGPMSPARMDPPPSDPRTQGLFPPLATESDWETERTAAVLAVLGNPHLAYPTLHVGGTNGKGSVAAVLASVLSASGRRTGLYTSPHLIDFGERIQVDGRVLEDGRLRQYAREVQAAVVRGGLTFFEAATVLAFHAFRREAVEVAVVEVGLGGRLDATNVVMPACSIVTNIALDHAEYLGDTLAAIAREKAGIFKPGVPALSSEQNPDILALLREAAAVRGAPFTALDASRELGRIRVGREGTSFVLSTRVWGDLSLHTPLIGRHQATNVALAVRALEGLGEALRPDAETVQNGVASVRWPGRVQIEKVGGLTWLLDVAHNPAGVEALAAVVDELALPRPVVALVGVLGDKDWRAMLPPLLHRADLTVLTQPPTAPTERRWDLDEAAVRCGALSGGVGGPVIARAEFLEAFEAARNHAGGGTVVVTGSAYTVGAALRALGTKGGVPLSQTGAPL